MPAYAWPDAFAGEDATVTMREALMSAMHMPDDPDTVRRIHEFGLAVANEDTMSRAIHDVYCGIMADHEHPNDKDREQARAMVAALQRHAAEA